MGGSEIRPSPLATWCHSCSFMTYLLKPILPPPRSPGPWLSDKERERWEATPCSICHLVLGHCLLCESRSALLRHRMPEGGMGEGTRNNFPGISDSISCKLGILLGCSGPRLGRRAPLIALQSCLPSALSPDSGNASRRHSKPLGVAGSWVI